MTENKVCPKCNGAMSQGRIMKFNEFAARKQYMYVFAPDDESGPNLSNVLSGKGASASRKTLVAYCCDACGFVEFYGIATS